MRTIDAVGLGSTPRADAGTTPTVGEAGAPPAPGAGPIAPSTSSGDTARVWPNAASTANSDAWIVDNHDQLVEMDPRVLLLHFYNGIDVSQAQKIAQSQMDAIAEGSRYRGYSDSTAAPFLRYQLVKVVDLTDHTPPAGWPYVSSTLLPTDSSGAFDVTALFSQSFAANYGFPDPGAPQRNLTLCELFEHGVINELWLSVGETGARAPGLMMESKQVYDADFRPIAGSFDQCTGYACLQAPHCAVSARIAHLSPVNGPGCDLLVRTAGLENTHQAIPYLSSNSLDFFNDEFSKVGGTRFDSYEDFCGTQGSCIDYPSETVAEGTYVDGSRWRMDPYVQGCGTAHFPSNARSRWDYSNTQPVLSRCEHYRMRDGQGGADLQEPYSSDSVSAYTMRFGSDCGGGWQVYLRQSVPGLHNAAYASDGARMKNWWPFLFY